MSYPPAAAVAPPIQCSITHLARCNSNHVLWIDFVMGFRTRGPDGTRCSGLIKPTEDTQKKKYPGGAGIVGP